MPEKPQNHAVTRSGHTDLLREHEELQGAHIEMMKGFAQCQKEYFESLLTEIRINTDRIALVKANAELNSELLRARAENGKLRAELEALAMFRPLRRR